jgi:Ni,Fe-hydrogenase I small subunit
LLVGQNPTVPEKFGKILLFGDCAINSTKNSDFRTIKKESKKKKIKKEKKQKSQKNPKTKFKTNKEILELPGCPPDILNCLTMLIKFYGKSNMPNLSLFKEVLETWFNPNDKKYLKAMGVL